MASSLISLAEEILLRIVQYLHGDRASLAALMQTHRVLFRIAAPFLYASPFRLLQDEPNFHWSRPEETRRYDRLVHLLLVSSGLLMDRASAHPGFQFSDEDTLKDHQDQSSSTTASSGDSGSGGGGLLQWQQQSSLARRQHSNGLLPSYGPELVPLELPTTTDYLAYYKDMHHEPMLYESFMTLFPFIPHCYHAHPINFPALVHTHNQIELAMIDRLAPQLQSLTISLHFHVPRIKVPWLAHLRRLEIHGVIYGLVSATHFALGEIMMPPITRNNSTSSRARDQYSGAWPRLDQLLLWIADHNRLHGTLRELKIEHDPDDIQVHLHPSDRIIELIEVMGDQLEVLDVGGWPDAVRYLDRIPTTNLRSLILFRSQTPIQLWDHDKFCDLLKNATQLEDLQTFIAKPDIFDAWQQQAGPATLHPPSSLQLTQWQQQAGSDTLPSPSSLRLTPWQQQQHSQGRRRRRGMKRLELMGYAEVVNMAVNEATVLFADTLESITVRSWFRGRLSSIPLSWTTSGITSVVAGSHLPSSSSFSSPPIPMPHSSSTAIWLPQLTRLDLQGEIAWTFDFESLLSCPKLAQLRLAFSGPVPRKSIAKQAPTTVLRQLWSLQDIELEGSWETLSKKGWIDTLADIQHLERLVLSGCLGAQPDDMLHLVQSILGAGRRRCGEAWQQVQTLDEARAFQLHLRECERLRYVHMTKRIADGFKALWGPYLQTLDRSCPPPTALPDLAQDCVHRHVHRVQFSYLA